MRLISERKLLTTINSLSIDFKDDGNKAHYGSEIVFRHGFLQGVYFAETELQNLAIEFAEWISGNDCDWTPSTQCNLWQYKYKIQVIKINSEELFTKFIEQRKTN